VRVSRDRIIAGNYHTLLTRDRIIAGNYACLLILNNAQQTEHRKIIFVTASLPAGNTHLVCWHEIITSHNIYFMTILSAMMRCPELTEKCLADDGGIKTCIFRM
jgi:hypothetical protein